jgi:excinuclease ABC subunit C
MFDQKDLARYPELPGVYLMKDQAGTVIYVGKAKNLRARLKQYYGHDERVQIPHLLAHIADIETIITSSESEALLLEARLIKRFFPRYNVLFKDDKSSLLLRIGLEHPWPRIELVREKEDVPPRLFGPYDTSSDTKLLFDLVIRLFQLRQCSDEVFKSRVAPCLLHQLRRCTAPCVRKVRQEEYMRQVEEATQFLEGKVSDVKESLRLEMQAASDNLEFERAGVCLHRLQLLDSLSRGVIKKRQLSEKRTDVFGVWTEGSRFAFSVMHYRGDSLEYGESFIYTIGGEQEGALLEQLAMQYYAQRTDQVPQEVVLPSVKMDVKPLEEALSQHFERKVTLIQPSIGKKKGWVALACENARARIAQTLCGKERRAGVLESLEQKLYLKRFPLTIDCFDASHLAGKELVAASVRYMDGIPSKADYRYFIIRQVTTGDDLSMLQEAVRRRYSSKKEGGESFPDLLLVDGGKNQVHAIEKVLHELSLWDIDVVGIAKEKGRHDKGLTSELLYPAGKEEPIHLSKTSQELLFLQQVRDEAHRFVIQFHRKRRRKSTFSSELEGISGIGEKKRKKLLRAFLGIDALRVATVQEIAAKAGVSLKDATRVLEKLKTQS